MFPSPVTLAKLCTGIAGGAEASACPSWTRSVAHCCIRSPPSSNADGLSSRGSKGGGGGGGEAGREGAEVLCRCGRGGTSLAASGGAASLGCHSSQSWHSLRRVTHGTSGLDRQCEQTPGSSSPVSGEREC
eukprot:scaffold11251_cov112-Isochrysis_galbana.AAC.4